jgi:hypothetical protein
MLPAVVGILVFSVIAILVGSLSSHVRQSRNLEGIRREGMRVHDSAPPSQPSQQSEENEGRPTASDMAARGTKPKDKDQFLRVGG